jgi:hypothetical protein
MKQEPVPVSPVPVSPQEMVLSELFKTNGCIVYAADMATYLKMMVEA